MPLVAGTDAPWVAGVYPGSSLRDELRLLVESGLSPYEALGTATRVPGELVARHVRGAQRFGVVARRAADR